MQKLTEEELITLVGGFSITGTIINAFTSAGKFIYSMGQHFGGAIRRISTNKMCSCN